MGGSLSLPSLSSSSSSGPAAPAHVDTSYVGYAKSALPTFAVSLAVMTAYEWLTSVRSLSPEEVKTYASFQLRMPVEGYPLFSVFVSEIAQYRHVALAEVESAVNALDALFYLEAQDRRILKHVHLEQALGYLTEVHDSLSSIDIKLELHHQGGAERTLSERRRWMQVHEDGKELAQRAYNNILIAVRDENTYLVY